MRRFAVGEVALLVGPRNGLQNWHVEPYLGMRVTIQAFITPLDIWHYRVEADDGLRFFCAEESLEKLPPDEAIGKRESLGEWDLCPWKPERVTVSADGGT